MVHQSWTSSRCWMQRSRSDRTDVRVRMHRPRAVLLALIGLLACRDGSDNSSRAAPVSYTIAVDTVWRADPDNADLSSTYSPLQRGDSLLAVNTYENTYIAVLDPAGKTLRLIGRAGN